MYDIPELEKKWRKYKSKQIKKPLIIASVALALVSGVAVLAITYLGNKTETQSTTTAKVQPSTKQETKAMVITKEPAMQQQNQPPGGTQNALIQVQPTVAQPVNENNIDLSKATVVTPNVPPEKIRVIGFDKKQKKKVAKEYQDILIPKQSQQEIQEHEKIAEIKERFKTSQDPKDSLYIAKYYYKKGEYKKAENWAVNTNNLDGDIEESWLIFAKSRAKQGFRVDAIKVLQSYYDETSSPKAKRLLDKLRFGKDF